MAAIKRLAISGDVMFDYADYDGRTALHLAASMNHYDVIEYLMELGVPKNPKDRWGNTPLDDARASDATKSIELLYQKGARKLSRKPSKYVAMP